MKPYAREPRKYSSQGSGPGDMKKDLKRPEWSMKIIEGQQLVFSELTIFNFNGGKKCLSPGKSGLGWCSSL